MAAASGKKRQRRRCMACLRKLHEDADEGHEDEDH